MIVNVLLKEFKIFFKSSLSTQSLCHTVSPRVGVRFWARSRSRSPGFLEPESKYHKKNKDSTSLVPYTTRSLAAKADHGL